MLTKASRSGRALCALKVCTYAGNIRYLDRHGELHQASAASLGEKPFSYKQIYYPMWAVANISYSCRADDALITMKLKSKYDGVEWSKFLSQPCSSSLSAALCQFLYQQWHAVVALRICMSATDAGSLHPVSLHPVS
jgi:hypothetical protein